MSLSVVISTYNRQDKLKECLESVKTLADEIIVIDNSSADDSVTIAKRYTPHVFVRKNNPMLNVNKNYGFTKASKEWVLYLDDDETVTPELAEEIKNTMKDTKLNGYFVPRKNMIFGKWIEHTGWYPDYQLRLFKRGLGTYPEKHVHEMITVDGEIGHLHAPMTHANYESIASFLQKTIVLYAPNEAENLFKNGYTFSFADSVTFPVKEFMSRFFAREGYKDGFHGFMLSCLMAFYHLVVFAILWEKTGFQQQNGSYLPHLCAHKKYIRHEITYWQSTEQLKSEKNPMKKFMLKLKRKLV